MGNGAAGKYGYRSDGESFYESIFEAAEKFLDYAKTDRAFYELHQEEFDNFLTRSESTRACIADSLGELEGDVMLELGYFDEEEEDSEDESGCRYGCRENTV